jgi:hypothetical protein
MHSEFKGGAGERQSEEALLSTELFLACLGRDVVYSHTVSLFRRAIVNANDGYLVIQNKDAPKGYSDSFENYE